MFQKHFLVQHCLYSLQQSLPEGCALTISPLLIQYHRLDSKSATSFNVSAQPQPVELTRYYLNWDNFNQATEDSVTELLTGFWKKYAAYQEGDGDFELLGVAKESSWEEVQTAYRRLASTLHPDKGGDATEFDRVKGAYERLKQRR